jgi:hypothetical protein
MPGACCWHCWPPACTGNAPQVLTALRNGLLALWRRAGWDNKVVDAFEKKDEAAAVEQQTIKRLEQYIEQAHRDHSNLSRGR